MAGGVNPFGFSMGVLPAPRAPRQPKDLPSAPFGFAPGPSKMQQTLAILNEYNPLPAFERLLKSPMALGGPISERDIADGLMVSGTVTGGSAAAPKPKNALNMGIRAYHGSPHDFDRFDMSKIGTGEGAQAYGHGLYFADSEGVAKSYRDALSNRDGSGYATAHLNAQNLVSKVGGDAEYAAQVLRDQLEQGGDEFTTQKLKDTLDFITSGKYAEPLPPAGRMYEVEINADPDAFLDWDKPLPMDSPLRKKLEDFAMSAANGPSANERNIGKDAFLGARNENLTGEGYYRSLSAVMDSNRARLREKHGALADDLPVGDLMRLESGAPGIKYLDAGSRAAGDGSRNYVVFDDSLVSIVRKYGIAGASAILGYNILDGIDPAQADELKRIEGNQ
jgi:hypothetical protein